jgi:hypothetical protein
VSLTPPRTASRHNAAFQIHSNAQRDRDAVARVVRRVCLVRLFPHSLSLRLLFLSLRFSLRAFVPSFLPLTLLVPLRLSLRVFTPCSCGPQGLWLLSLWGSLVGLCLPFFLSYAATRGATHYSALATASTSTSVAFEASEATPIPVTAGRELPRNRAKRGAKASICSSNSPRT